MLDSTNMCKNKVDTFSDAHVLIGIKLLILVRKKEISYGVNYSKQIHIAFVDSHTSAE